MSFSNLLQSGFSWEVELTSRCNSRCVGCSRYSHFYYPNPFFNSRLDLDIEVLKKALRESAQVDFILFCGNYGDPLLHPQIFDILEFIRQEKGSVGVVVHTNASFGSQDFWIQLASYFQTPGSFIKFSLDGLADSHEKFRRGTNWETALANAKTFIAAGGRAVWQMIDFAHNKNEIETAREMSQKLGFRRFDLRKNNYPGLDSAIAETAIDLRNPPASVAQFDLNKEELQTWYRSQLREKPAHSIECRSLTRKNIYLDVNGHVWPCCWVGGLPYRPEHELREWFQQETLNRYKKGFNSLVEQSLEQIFSHPWWQKHLPESWNLSAQHSPVVLSTCVKTCGKCVNEWAAPNV
ncbi:radical SAM protein [Bdellovibrio sp. HCB2-146]|uniref:radical SAM protein n=1 Tax=Bdellovibrio sp. HCB2-146 TaxID=3394362 RepID=UPI0039BD07FA